MATVSFRVPDDLRQRMEASEIDDWPDRVRAFLEEELRRRDVGLALEEADALRKKYARAAKKWSMSAEVIRSRYEDH